MITLYFILFGVISTILLLYYLCTRNFNYWKVRNIPGPNPIPLFGNIKKCTLRKENPAETYQKYYEDFPSAPVVGIYRMTSPCLLVRDLDIIKHIMVKDFDVFEDRGIEFSKEEIGANLFHSDGKTWRALRHRFTPLFSSGKLKGMFHLIVDQCDKFMKYLEQSVKSQPEQEIYSLLKRYTKSAIMACAFGLDIDSVSQTLMSKLIEIDHLTLKAHILHEVDMMFPGIFKNFSSSLFPAEVQRFFENLISDVIEERNGKPTNRHDFIDLILEMKQEGSIAVKRNSNNYDENESIALTNSIISAQALAFYVAGYETSATTLSFMLYELAFQPEVQDKVIKEIDEVLMKHNGKISYETINDLVYTDMVFNETYRKYPIVPLQRKANANYKIPGTQILIEKNTVIVISALGIHYDENYYPNPKKFDPERFNQTNSKDRHPCAFLPFGVGPRNCIGIRFAKLQTRVLIMRLLSKFRIEPSPRTNKIVFDPKRLFVNPISVYLNLVPRTN